MERNGDVPVIVVCAFFVGLGVALLWAAPSIQRMGLRMMGQPRNRVAAWGRDRAASRTSLRRPWNVT